VHGVAAALALGDLQHARGAVLYEAGYPPVRNVTSRIIDGSRMLTVPPADAKFANVLMFGTSTLSTTNRFSRDCRRAR